MEWIGGGLTALALAGIGLMAVYLANAKRLMARVDELTTRVFRLQDEALECHQREADLKTEVASLTRRISRLDGNASAESRVGVIVCDLKGIIRVFSPSLVAVFKWLPQQVLGQPVTVLMDAREAAAHGPRFAAWCADPSRRTDPEKVIITYAKDRLGNRIPVSITLDGWQVGNEGLITATVRERASNNDPPSDEVKAATGRADAPPRLP